MPAGRHGYPKIVSEDQREKAVLVLYLFMLLCKFQYQHLSSMVLRSKNEK